MEFRPIAPEHAAAAVACLNAIAAADSSGEYVTTEDFLMILDTPGFTPIEDFLAVWQDDQLIAYAAVMPPEERDGLTLREQKGGVHPDHRRRGIGSHLLDWIARRAPVRPGFALEAGVHAGDEGGRVLLTGRGYEPIRYFNVMQRLYDGTPVPPGPVPDGFEVIPFVPAYDEALRLAHNEIFQDHWGTSPKDEDDWKKWFTGRSVFRPGLSYLVLDGERIAAYTLAYEYDVDTEKTGVREIWAGQVGTRREYRGQGLARAALTAVLRAGASAGFERSGLGVDTESPTGASRLYEALGYRTVNTKVLYRRTQ